MFGYWLAKKLRRIYYTDFSELSSHGNEDRDLPPGGCREGTFHMGDLFPAFRGTEGQRVLLELAVSQVTLTQTNQYVTVEYFGWQFLVPYKLVFK